MSGRDRHRGIPSSLSPQKDPRAAGDPRNGGGPMPGASGMTRAQKFEDEKQRIVQTCFSKKEADGTIVESYITHIRVTEDSSSSSNPPPPNSPPEKKKPRVIIVAVRKSGRVRVHKARENENGSFSIGKTWMLDELTSIRTYENSVPTNPVEQQEKQWASNIGFVVTLGKPYYWQSDTPKERDFFIGSLVKIYKKYTGGKLPTLIGFDARDREILTGNSPGQPARPPRIPDQAPNRPDPRLPRSRSPSVQRTLPQSPLANRAPSRDGPREARKQPSREQFMRSQASQEQMQRMRPPFSPSQPLPTPPSRDGPISKAPESPNVSENAPPASLPTESAPKKRPEGKLPPSLETGIPRPIPPPTDVQPAARDRLQLNLDFGNASPLEPLKQKYSSQEKANELRPSTGGSKGSQKSFLADFEETLATSRSTPDVSKVDLRPQSRGSTVSNKTTPSEASQRPATGLPKGGAGAPPVLPSISIPTLDIEPPAEPSEGDATRRRESAEPAPLQIGAKKIASSPTASPTTEGETHRPGLGPMVKKKAGKDLANTFRKAATAYSAFKPRAGGAAERLMAAKQKAENEPDGITSVVPAPFSRTQPTEVGAGAATPPETPASQELPKVQISPAPAETAKQIEPVARRKRPISPQPLPEPLVDNSVQYCAALGIDHTLIEGRAVEFDHILTDLGWNGKLKDDKSADDFEADIRREIGRVQASSWLGHIESQANQIGELGQLFDRTIEECEELDGLLTLYSHELSTLADDVAYIEGQAEGLQVRISNKKLLQAELQNLLHAPESI